jgi:outer membrane protein
MRKILIIVLTTFAFSAFASSPKLGHINTAELMSLMPESEVAAQALQTHQRELEEIFRAMSTEFENAMQDFQANQQQWSELIRNTRVRAIQDLQSRIEDFQRSAEQTFEQERERLFTPIVEKARKAIEDVAKEHKFSYVFDTSGGTLLYAIDSENILELVKKKLSLK